MAADRKLFTLVSLLIGISIILAYSLSSYVTLLFGVKELHFAIRQAIFGFIGIILMWSLAQLNPDKWLVPIGFTIFIGSAILMAAMPFLPESLVSAVGGAKRWIKVAGFSLAPVEFFKIGFIFFLAWSFSRKLNNHDGMGIKEEILRIWQYIFLFGLAVAAIAVFQKDLGQVMVLAITFLILLLFGGSSFRLFFSLLSVAMVGLIVLILFFPHRIKRFASWWSSKQDFLLPYLPNSISDKLRIPVDEIPYQIGHSLNAIHNGGIFGSGMANGTFKLGFLSEIHTDFVLAGLAEEFGFLGVLFVVMIFLWIILRIFKIANRTEDKTIYLFCIGIGILLSSTFMLNAYGISGLTPIKGISVPFLSYGGSAIIAACIGIGMVLMASKKANMKSNSLFYS
ncbi:MAG: FtsW/RodA/SpoVE family cell cycle protein [Campylobacterota bacterium]|nr:FtsW/RodA/SpoVE family cell cycle protein [Campylobacterota bacterium]